MGGFFAELGERGEGLAAFSSVIAGLDPAIHDATRAAHLERRGMRDYIR
jgi:hypothetical protein